MKLEINHANTLKLMQATFTSSLTFISEAMQNARRAGATRVTFTVTRQEDGKLDMVIEDNGKGVASFQDLLTIAQSGWDEETTRHDKPFGVGFLSVLLACETGQVNSNGTEMRWTTKDLINGGVAWVGDSETAELEGTKIQLFNVCHEMNFEGKQVDKDLIERFIRRMASGFPIEVCVGDSLPLMDEESVNNTLASIEVPGVGLLCLSQSTSVYERKRIYLQGLPVSMNSGEDANRYCGIVLHLDSERFQARMPDRDRLVGVSAETLWKDLENDGWISKLAEAAFHRLNRKIMTVGLFDLLVKNDETKPLIKTATCLPGGLFRGLEKDYDDTYDYDLSDGWGRNNNFTRSCSLSTVNKSVFEEEGYVVFNGLPDSREENQALPMIALQQIIKQKGFPGVLEPVNHLLTHLEWTPSWLPEFVNIECDTMDSEEFIITPEKYETKLEGVSIPGVNSNVTVYTCAKMKVVFAPYDKKLKVHVPLFGTILTENWYDPFTKSLYLVDTRVSESIYKQTGDCRENDNESEYDEVLIESYIEAANLIISNATHPDGEGLQDRVATVIRDKLNAGLACNRPLLSGMTFTVTFSDEGYATVQAAQ